MSARNSSEVVTHDEHDLLQTVVYDQSPRAPRRHLHQDEEETAFGANIENVTLEPGSSDEPASGGFIDTPPPKAPSVQRQTSNAEEQAYLTEAERLPEVKERMELVSKQSRPFLMFKIVEWLFAAVVLPLNACTWPVMLLRGNIHIAMQPPLACATFLIYCPVIFFGYLADLQAPATLMLLMDALGGAYFTVAAVTCGIYWSDVTDILNSQHILEPPTPEMQNIVSALRAIGLEGDVHLTADKLLMQCLLCSSAATMYLGDVFLTLKYLVFRRIPLIIKRKSFFS